MLLETQRNEVGITGVGSTAGTSSASCSASSSSAGATFLPRRDCFLSRPSKPGMKNGFKAHHTLLHDCMIRTCPRNFECHPGIDRFQSWCPKGQSIRQQWQSFPFTQHLCTGHASCLQLIKGSSCQTCCADPSMALKYIPVSIGSTMTPSHSPLQA